MPVALEPVRARAVQQRIRRVDLCVQRHHCRCGNVVATQGEKFAPDDAFDQVGIVGKTAAAERIAASYRDLFGRDNFFLELQHHNLPVHELLCRRLTTLGKRMNIGIYGGTFNPPHLGHLILAQSAIDALDLDHVLFVPAFQSPFKLRSESLSAAGNIFMGQTEAPLLIRPYLKELGRSDLFLVMTVGMAGTNSGVLGFSADAYRFELDLENRGGDWRVIAARWGELGAELR